MFLNKKEKVMNGMVITVKGMCAVIINARDVPAIARDVKLSNGGDV